MNTNKVFSPGQQNRVAQSPEKSLKSVASKTGSGLKGIVSLKRLWRERGMEFEKLDRERCWILIRVC